MRAKPRVVVLSPIPLNYRRPREWGRPYRDWWLAAECALRRRQRVKLWEITAFICRMLGRPLPLGSHSDKEWRRLAKRYIMHGEKILRDRERLKKAVAAWQRGDRRRWYEAMGMTDPGAIREHERSLKRYEAACREARAYQSRGVDE